MAVNTTFNPSNMLQVDKNKLNLHCLGVTGTATGGGTTHIDYKLTDDCLLAGGEFITKTSVFGDSITFQVVDVDGIVSPAGTVLNEFVTNFYLIEDQQKQFGFRAEYPAKIISGLYLRLIYNSTGLLNVKVAMNYILHKVLI
jgi:hypothetical protein